MVKIDECKRRLPHLNIIMIQYGIAPEEHILRINHAESGVRNHYTLYWEHVKNRTICHLFLSMENRTPGEMLAYLQAMADMAAGFYNVKNISLCRSHSYQEAQQKYNGLTLCAAGKESEAASG